MQLMKNIKRKVRSKVSLSNINLNYNEIKTNKIEFYNNRS